MTIHQAKSLPERILGKLLENRLVAYVVVAGIVLGAMANVSDSISKLAGRLWLSMSDFPVSVHGFPTEPGRVSGVTFDLYIDGNRIERVSNLQGAPFVQLGSLSKGKHTFRLADIDSYLIDLTAGPLLMPNYSRLNCNGTFDVAGPTTFELFMRLDESGIHCALQ